MRAASSAQNAWRDNFRATQEAPPVLSAKGVRSQKSTGQLYASRAHRDCTNQILDRKIAKYARKVLIPIGPRVPLCALRARLDVTGILLSPREPNAWIAQKIRFLLLRKLVNACRARHIRGQRIKPGRKNVWRASMESGLVPTNVATGALKTIIARLLGRVSACAIVVPMAHIALVGRSFCQNLGGGFPVDAWARHALSTRLTCPLNVDEEIQCAIKTLRRGNFTIPADANNAC